MKKRKQPEKKKKGNKPQTASTQDKMD